MTEIEIIDGLLKALAACRECSQPATHCTETAEIGYYVYYCDEHKTPLSAGYGEVHKPQELKVAGLVREAQRVLEEYSSR